MTNLERLQKKTAWEMAEFIHKVSEHDTKITTCDRECAKCEFSDAYCINGIGEWLNMESD